MFLQTLLDSPAESLASDPENFYLRLLPERSNRCLDEDLQSINEVLDKLLERGLPYEPYVQRFNELQGYAEVFRTLFPRPLPGTPDELVTAKLTAQQMERVERLKTGLVVLRADLMRASAIFDDIKALPPAAAHVPAAVKWIREAVLGPAARVRLSISRSNLRDVASTALREGRLDDAQRLVDLIKTGASHGTKPALLDKQLGAAAAS
jgi:hypothetical protein